MYISTEKNRLINNITLLIGLLIHSVLYFSVLGADIRFSIFSWGLWVWITIPYLTFFLANCEFNETKGASNIILAGIVVLISSSIVINIQYVEANDPLAIIMFAYFPLFALFINIFFGLIAAMFNKSSKKRRRH